MRICYLIPFVCFFLLSFSGCKKDTDKNIENPGISFLYGANSKNDFILRPSASPQIVTNLLVVNLRGANPAAGDIHVSITDNTAALVNAYNTANGTSVLPLPHSVWDMPSELVIKKGEQYAYGEIIVSNITSLNFSKQYAIGVSISGVSNGEKLADKLSNVFIVFSIRNIWDGKYRMKGQFYHPALEPSFAAHDMIIELRTRSDNTLWLWWPYARAYATPATTNGGLPYCCLGSQQLAVGVHPASDTVFCWDDYPSSFTNYQPLKIYNANNYQNRWDPLSRTFYLCFGYNFANGQFVPGTSRAWIDTLTYLGPR